MRYRWAVVGLLSMIVGACTSAGSDPAPDPAGAELFAIHCSNCHGDYADGGGIMAPSLSVVLTDLRYLSARNDGVFPQQFVRDIIDGRVTRAAHGPVDMPVWGAVFTAQEGQGREAQAEVRAKIDSVTRYLEYIQQPK